MREPEASPWIQSRVAGQWFEHVRSCERLAKSCRPRTATRFAGDVIFLLPREAHAGADGTLCPRTERAHDGELMKSAIRADPTS